MKSFKIQRCTLHLNLMYLEPASQDNICAANTWKSLPNIVGFITVSSPFYLTVKISIKRQAVFEWFFIILYLELLCHSEPEHSGHIMRKKKFKFGGIGQQKYFYYYTFISEYHFWISYIHFWKGKSSLKVNFLRIWRNPHFLMFFM